MIYNVRLHVLFLSVMQTTWRERNQQTRIKSAKEALDKNPEYVIYLQLYSIQ